MATLVLSVKGKVALKDHFERELGEFPINMHLESDCELEELFTFGDFFEKDQITLNMHPTSFPLTVSMNVETLCGILSEMVASEIEAA